MEIAIVADTHMPRGPRRLPDGCVARLRAADLIIHAGDLMSLSVLHELRGYGPVVAVHGNVDDPEVRMNLPAVAVVPAGGQRIYVIHDAGPSAGRLDRLRARFSNADAVVFGHSHIPLHARAEDGFQIFNPGSPTERRRSPHHTMGLARADKQGLEFELIELD
jgi:putative phosphoesterase